MASRRRKRARQPALDEFQKIGLLDAALTLQDPQLLETSFQAIMTRLTEHRKQIRLVIEKNKRDTDRNLTYCNQTFNNPLSTDTQKLAICKRMLTALGASLDAENMEFHNLHEDEMEIMVSCIIQLEARLGQGMSVALHAVDQAFAYPWTKGY